MPMPIGDNNIFYQTNMIKEQCRQLFQRKYICKLHQVGWHLLTLSKLFFNFQGINATQNLTQFDTKYTTSCCYFGMTPSPRVWETLQKGVKSEYSALHDNPQNYLKSYDEVCNFTYIWSHLTLCLAKLYCVSKWSWLRRGDAAALILLGTFYPLQVVPACLFQCRLQGTGQGINIFNNMPSVHT